MLRYKLLTLILFFSLGACEKNTELDVSTTMCPINPEEALWASKEIYLPEIKMRDATKALKMLIFLDYQSAGFYEVLLSELRRVNTDFSDKVAIEIYHYPLDKKCNRMMRKQYREGSCEIAKFAICTKQNRALSPFEDALTQIYEKKHKWPESKKDIAELLNLSNIERCMKAPMTSDTLLSDLNIGDRLGVTGTPTIFINGRQFRPHGSLYDFTKATLRKKC